MYKLLSLSLSLLLLSLLLLLLLLLNYYYIILLLLIIITVIFAWQQQIINDCTIRNRCKMNIYSVPTFLEAESPGLRLFPSIISSVGGLLSAPKPNPFDLGMYSMGSVRLKLK